MNATDCPRCGQRPGSRLRGRWESLLWVVVFATLTGYNVAVGEAGDAALSAFMGGLWVASLLWWEKP